MGSRGPIARGQKTRAKSMKTADGRRLRRLPADADAIARRLARDIPGLTDADMALVEDTARWVAVAAGAYSQLIEGKPQPTAEQLERQEVETLLLTVTDTAHGNKEESRKNPLLIVMRTASEQIRANAQQLGASPLSRARMPEPEREQLSLADVLFGDAVAHAPAPAANDE